MKTVVKSYFGSQLYGTSTPESDTDYKEIFIPHPKDILMCRAMNHTNLNTNNSATKNTHDDVDHELYSLKYFLELAKNGETVALDMLHTPPELVVASDLPEVWKFVQDNRSKFYTTDMKAYLGYVRKQAAKYGVKGSRLAALREVKEFMDALQIHENPRLRDLKVPLPQNEFCFWTHIEENPDTMSYYTMMGRKYMAGVKIAEFCGAVDKLWAEYGDRARKAEANEGIDWKALSHAMRGGLQLLEIYKTGDLKYPLADAEEIKLVKAGKLPFAVVQERLEEIVGNVDTAAKEASKNGMPDKVDIGPWEAFVEQVYAEAMKEYLESK